MKTEARYRINDSIKNYRQIFRKYSPRYFYNLWYEIIWDYSNRLLTEESDKLPGLAGLAHTLANMIGDEYVAGLWKKDIVSGLLWKARRWNMDEDYKGRRIPRRSIRPSPPGFAPSGPHGAIQHTRPSCWRAPSWSWASLDGQVRHETVYRGEGQDDGRFIPENIAIDTSSSRCSDVRHLSLSETAAHRLTLKGYIQPAKTKYFLRDLFLDNLDSDFWTEGYKTLHAISDTSSPALSSDELMEEAAVVGNWNDDKQMHSDQEQNDCIGVIQYDVVDDIATNQTVHVLGLRQLEREPSWQDDTPYCIPTERDERGYRTQQYQLFGLALVPTGNADNEYRRIGFAEFITPSWFKEDSKRTVILV
ncbi:heterokaryon incompatibility protein [Colletotrichum camelliae]|nr:heterokaryon incompatibility protein [Colletotrichum camelliae]